ncbi:lipase family protein [Fodinicola feengrottensis]|uniref:Lipase family protein n=1 Tax=Fodinicola feengrottensis TaxID=435914 RepID=A0ABN2IM42_9ACTN|nr:lipase family protein [Fodinicola feengrottensis]
MTTPRWRALSIALATLLSCLLVGASGTAAHAAQAAPAAVLPPDQDPFYQPPAGFEASSPGTILRERQVAASTYLIPVPARVFQVLVRTNDANDQAIATVSTVVVPLTPYPGKRPLLSFQIAIDSLGRDCNPSYELRQGTELDSTGIWTPLSYGWAAVITDFEGPKMTFAVGRVAGHATLDGIRAALTLPEAGLDVTTPIAGWGYSGGGQATAWAAQMQPGYAPELNVKGWVAGDFPGDLKKTLVGVDGGPFSGFTLGAVVGMQRQYPELTSLFNDKGKQLESKIGKQCLVQLVSTNTFQKVSDYTTADVVTDPRTQRMFADNSTGATAPSAPVLFQQSPLDEIIRPDFNIDTYHSWCAKGSTVQYQDYPVPEHVLNLFATIPNSLVWLTSRFAGLPASSTC